MKNRLKVLRAERSLSQQKLAEELGGDAAFHQYDQGDADSIAALAAAVNPADGDSLFFVSRGDGSHVFSATVQEHNAAVRKYQLKR